MIRLTTYDDASRFLRDVQAWLEREEAANGLILGLAMRLAEEPLTYGSLPYLASVADEHGPVLAALMTPPYHLILCSEQESVPEPLELLARDLSERRWPVPGASGPVRLVQAFAGLWARLAGAEGRPSRSERLYKLSEVIHPQYSPGRLRHADEEDAGLVLGWMDAFRQEAIPDSPPTSLEMTYARIAERSVFLWVDGRPACMAVKTRPTQHGISVSWVYTPPELRRRGYATSCVAALSQQLLDAGFEFCSLFTDLSNPTSNHVYQEIGYRPVCDFQEIKFD